MRVIISALFGLLFLATSIEAQVISPRLLATLGTASSRDEISVLVTLHDKAELRPFIARRHAQKIMSTGERRAHRTGIIRALKAKADQSQPRLIKFLKAQGILHIKSLWIINAIALNANPDIIQLLASMPEVASIRPDSVIQLPNVTPTATGGIEDNLLTLRVPELWNLGLTGQGIVVATMDTGADIDHPDLASRWRGGTNSWFDPNGEHPTTAYDNDGHGTAVMGLLVGGNTGGSAIGVAPDAQWIAVKIFDDAGNSRLSKIHEGYQWLLDPDGNPSSDDAPDIINNSWGFEENPGICADQTNQNPDLDVDFHPDLLALKTAGIAVIFSAGNGGPALASDVSPANYPEAFSVGSVGTSLSTTEISDFSSRGPSACDGTLFPDVVAPGFPIRSAGLSFGGAANYQHGLAGTSFSAPQVAGVMALLLQKFPGIPLADIEDALKFSATDLGNSGSDNDYGYGLVSAPGAYAWLSQAPNIAIIDPIPPTDDRLLPFGTLPRNTPLQRSLICSNVGRGDLALGRITLSGSSTFTLLSDSCSQQSLIEGESCSLVVEFSSTVPGTFSGSLEIPSNDINEAVVTVSLDGVVADGATPPPVLILSDSVPPAWDSNLAYTQVLIGDSKTESLQIANSGTGDLSLGTLDSSLLDSAFSIFTDSCSNQVLANSQVCSVDITFTPNRSGIFNGSLRLSSNDPIVPSVQIILSGEGNSIPPAPTLVSPADNTSNLTSSVVFSWLQQPDDDGDKVTNELTVSPDPGFAPAVAIQVLPSKGSPGVLLAGAGGGLLLWCGFLLGLKRQRYVMTVLLVASTLLLMTSCGGSGGSSVTAPNLHSQTLSGLSPQTTYYWKVSATDGHGGSSESQVRSFATR